MINNTAISHTGSDKCAIFLFTVVTCCYRQKYFPIYQSYTCLHLPSWGTRRHSTFFSGHFWHSTHWEPLVELKWLKTISLLNVSLEFLSVSIKCFFRITECYFNIRTAHNFSWCRYSAGPWAAVSAHSVRRPCVILPPHSSLFSCTLYSFGSRHPAHAAGMSTVHPQLK